jgi:hypothetical protein
MAVGGDEAVVVVVVVVVALMVCEVVVTAAAVFSVPVEGDLSMGDDELDGASWFEVEAFAGALLMADSTRDSVASACPKDVRLELLDPVARALAAAAAPAAVIAGVVGVF